MMDSILHWNAAALEANRVSHSDPDKREQNGPTLSSRALAIVHLAMYDAYAGIVNNAAAFPRYLTASTAVVPAAPSPKPPTWDQDAVAGAAYRTLTALYPAQQSYFETQRGCFDTTSLSYQFGEAIGAEMLALRANDMDARDSGYRPSPLRGRHRVDPDNPGQGFHAPFYGAQNKCFAVTARHALQAPPFASGADAKYLQALAQVRTKGIRPDLTGTLPDQLFDQRRTPLETVIGIYWGFDGANRLGTPPRMFNQIVRRVAENRGNNEGQNARLFAFVNAAMGDAGILAWEQKYCHDFWRPVVGIREHDEKFGPQAPYAGTSVSFNDGDPGWLPLGAPSTNQTAVKNFSPNFPAYPSGHATFGAAALQITRLFYNVKKKDDDNLFPMTFVSEEFNGGNRDNDGAVRPRHARSFPGGLWQMIIENGLSRVYLGVHWIFDAFDFSEDDDGNLVPDLTNEQIGGVGLGLRIAEDIFNVNGGLTPVMPAAGAADPVIETPAPDSPLAARPAQPASIGGCVAEEQEIAALENREQTRSVEDPFPTGSSEHGEPPTENRDAYPSKRSKK